MAAFYKFVAFLLLATQAIEGHTFKNFFAGRRSRTGFLPPPPKKASNDPSNVSEFYFSQKLDHFNDSITETWQQRYQVNNAYYDHDNGPIFIMISGEAEADAGWLEFGQMYENGKKHNASLMQLEHRFYGKSFPTKDASEHSLRYLSSRQALADLDHFITFIKEHYGVPDAKVIVFGGSYAGNLAAWFREVYPDSSVGAVASSAPVLAEEDFIEYMETVGESMKYYDPKCYDAVDAAFQAVEGLVAAQNDTALNSLFGLCGGSLNYSDPYEIETFYNGLRSDWMYATQYNTYGPDSILATYCHTMTNETLGTPLERFSIWYQSTLEPCIDVRYKDMVEALKKEALEAAAVVAGIRQWLWQTCTEFGYYQTTDAKDQPFGFKTIDLTYIEDLSCTLPFGFTHDDIAANIAQSNKNYGGKSPNAKKVFLFNGSIDPWHKLGIYEHDLNDQSPSRYIEGTSHCYDMFEAQPNDPAALTKAREDMASTITQWLTETTSTTAKPPFTITHSGTSSFGSSAMLILAAVSAIVMRLTGF